MFSSGTKLIKEKEARTKKAQAKSERLKLAAEKEGKAK